MDHKVCPTATTSIHFSYIWIYIICKYCHISCHYSRIYYHTCCGFLPLLSHLLSTITSSPPYLDNIYIYIFLLSRAGFIRYSAISALEVIRWNWCLVMNLKQMQDQIHLKNLSTPPVSTRYSIQGCFRLIYFKLFFVDDGIYSAEESCF